MTVKRIESQHLREVAQLEQTCFRDPWSENSLKLLTTDMAIGFVCVDEDTRVMAYGGMLWAPDEGQITNIAVHPDFRHQGLGKAVLRALISAAWERDCHALSLEVRASNEAAIALYQNEGFFVAGQRKHFYRAPTEDALVMLLTRDASVG